MRRLVVSKTLTHGQALKLFFHFVRCGDHLHEVERNLPDDQLFAYLDARGYRLGEMLSELMADPHATVREFENLIDGIAMVVEAGGPAQVIVQQRGLGVVTSEHEVKDGEVILREPFKSEFMAACAARDASIEKSSIDEFYTALSKAFASFDALFSLTSTVHNAHASAADQLIDQRGSFVNLDNKIKVWLPKMTGVSINLGKSPSWADYLFLQQLRHDAVIHPKPGRGLKSIGELADSINRFRSLGELMFVLLRAFKIPVQSSVIRAMCFPDVSAETHRSTPISPPF